MDFLTIAVLTCTGLVVLAGCWLGWQLLRQNGRILLRLDELEDRLNELEFGGAEEPEGLAVGTDAPAFTLQDLAGKSRTLAEYRGQTVLLVFFNPDCGFCREMMPKLAEVAAGFQPAAEVGILPPGMNALSIESSKSFNRAAPSDDRSAGLEARLNGRQGCPPPRPIILTTGDAEKNRQFFAEHKVSCPVLLQKNGEVAKAYQTHGTPSGYLVSPEGMIASNLAMGAEALLALADGISEVRNPNPEEDQSRLTSGATDGRARHSVRAEVPSNANGAQGTDAPYLADHANRFGNRSLAKSKIERDGLEAGTPAPDFQLPRLDGKGDLSLSELRGKRVLLVFSSPGCGPCDALAPALERFHREQADRDWSPVAARGHTNGAGLIEPRNGTSGAADGDRPRSESVAVVMISKGDPKENRAKVKEHGLTFPIVLQQQWEISRRYAMFATPIAYLIDEQGVIAESVAVGTEGIEALMARARLLGLPTLLPA